MQDNDEQIQFIFDTVEYALINDIKIFDASTGQIKRKGTSYEDLGDYLPALIFYGKQKSIKREVDKTIASLSQGNHVFTKDQTGIAGNFARAYDQSDLIWGLQLAAREEPSLNTIIDQTLDAFWLAFWGDSGVMMRLTKVPGTKIKIPISLQPKLKMLSSEDHGMFIELYAHQYITTRQARHLERAIAIKDAFANTKMYIENKVFPFYTANDLFSRAALKGFGGFRKRNTQFQLLKQNSNTLWGFFKLHDVAENDTDIGQQIQATLDAWLRQFYDQSNGVFLTNFDFSTGRRGADLTCFHMIELLIESAQRFKRIDHLKAAGRIADSFLSLQSSKTGLIPFLHPSILHEIPRFRIYGGISWLDSTVDFAIAILKLGIAENSDVRLDQFKRIVNGVCKYHKLQYGYAASVFIDDGRLDNPIYSTKMTALILKLFIAIADGKNISNTQSNTHYALLDR